MRVSCLAVFLLFHTGISGQSKFNADSVEKIFAYLPDTLKIKEANNLMKYYMDIDFKKSTYYAHQAFELADKVSNQEDIAMTYISWAIAQYNFGRYEQCLEFNFKALELYQSMEDTVRIATAFNNIGIAYNALGDFSTAAYYSYKAYGIHESKKNWKKAAISCMNISSSYFESKDYPATLYWSRKGYDYYGLAEQPEDLGYAIQIFIDVHIALKQVDSALYYFRQVQQLNKQYPNEYLETVNLSQRGEIHALQGKYDSAIILQEKVIRFYDELEMSDAVLLTRLSIARAYMAIQKWDEAHLYAREAYASSKLIRNKPMIVKSSVVLADIFKARHQPGPALEYAQLASVYKDSIMMQALGGSIEGRFYDVRLEKETREKLRAMSTLKERNETIGTQWLIITLVTGGLMVMAVMAFVIRRVGRYRKKLNVQLTASNERLSELNHEVNGLVNTIIHDLKSPLNSVQGILSLMEMSAGKNEDTVNLIRLANKSVRNGHDIIRQLLELREVEENPGQINLSEIDTQELTENIYNTFHLSARQKKITFSVTSDHYRFISDSSLVQRVLDNLVSNALKFSPKESEVKLTVRKEHNKIIFEVCDQGPGFSQEDLKKIYGKFQKLSARPTAGENSNGLGLATVSLLMKRLQGTITLHTEPGRGSVFTLTFLELGDPA